MTTARLLALCSCRLLTPQLQPTMMLQTIISLIRVCERPESHCWCSSVLLVTRCMLVCVCVCTTLSN